MPNAEILVADLDVTFGQHPLAHWKQVLDVARLPYGVVQIPEEIVLDPQLHANGILVPFDDDASGTRYTVNSPVTIAESPKVAPRRAPELGEHTDEVLGHKAK